MIGFPSPPINHNFVFTVGLLLEITMKKKTKRASPKKHKVQNCGKIHEARKSIV